jgi:hypothetical protein
MGGDMRVEEMILTRVDNEVDRIRHLNALHNVLFEPFATPTGERCTAVVLSAVASALDMAIHVGPVPDGRDRQCVTRSSARTAIHARTS